MKIRLPYILAAAPLFTTLSATAANASNTLKIVNHTNTNLTIQHANGNKLVKIHPDQHLIMTDATETYHFPKIASSQEDLLGLQKQRHSNGKELLFGVAADGIHGYVSNGYSFRWNESTSDPILIVCQTKEVANCH